LTVLSFSALPFGPYEKNPWKVPEGKEIGAKRKANPFDHAKEDVL